MDFGGNEFFKGGFWLMLLGAGMALLRGLPLVLKGWLERQFTVSVEIPDRDPAFRWVYRWVATQRYAKTAKILSLETTWESEEETNCRRDYEEGPGGVNRRVAQAKFILSPAPGTHVMWYRGRLLVMFRHRRDLEQGGSYAFQETVTLRLIFGSRNLVHQLLDEMNRAARPSISGVDILTVGNHRSWVSSSWRPRRPLGSVILDGEILSDLLSDLRRFLDRGKWYSDRGVPHRRGYLLTGPPGNGKTTLVLAVAGELGMTVSVLDLNHKELTDDGLRSVVDGMSMGSFLLIEDVDCAMPDAERRRAGDDTGVTLSGLLNAIDGVSSREGRVLFMTTNHPERLDPALVRPGRVDRTFRLGDATRAQAEAIFAWFYGLSEPSAEVLRLACEFAKGFSEGRVCVAALQEYLLRYPDDPEGAAREVDFPVLADQAARGEFGGSDFSAVIAEDRDEVQGLARGGVFPSEEFLPQRGVGEAVPRLRAAPGGGPD